MPPKQSTDLVDGDDEQVVQLCAAGARFANASEADLEAFEEAFAPVYAALEEDGPTKAFIEQIEALKQTTDPGRAIEVPSDCTGPADTGSTAADDTTPPGDAPNVAAINGTYRWTLTEEDARATGNDQFLTADWLSWYPMVSTMTLADGTWEMVTRGGDGAEDIVGPGTYEVDDNQLILDIPGDLPHAFTYSFDGDGNIDVEPVMLMADDSQFAFATRPWERIDGDGPDDKANEATIPDGTYRREVTEDALLAAGAESADARQEAGIYTLTL